MSDVSSTGLSAAAAPMILSRGHQDKRITPRPDTTLWYDWPVTLVQLHLPDTFLPAPPEVARFIVEAQSRIDSFIESRLVDPIHSFVPSDFSLVYSALRHVADGRLACGPAFCEWGSGAGVITCLAAMVGFDACGIEFEPDLVDLSIRLARHYHLKATFCRGNFIPHRGQKIAEQVSEFAWLAAGGPNPYDLMDVEIDDFDVVFAYPWPGEERVIERLFDRFASDGALLLTYNGVEGVHLFRKRSARAEAGSAYGFHQQRFSGEASDLPNRETQ
ncbi:MAG: hypothetical protein NT031_00635 [Planctomycetota bacterium]|nr:hypothetical protein [Planctomycetota bacterium]